MFEFGSPHFLWLLLALPVLAWWRRRRSGQVTAAMRYSDVRLLESAPRGPAHWWRRVAPAARLAVLALLILALARPRFGTVERDVIREGVDIFYCIDISGSMRAEDFQPNRLEKAKELIAEFAARRPNDRQGIVLFAGDSFVLCPLTLDQQALDEFLRNITFDDIGINATAIGMGLSRALKKLQASQAKSRVIVLITDGENNAGRIAPMQAVRVAAALGVRIYTIGVGSRGVAWIPVKTPFGVQRQPVQTSIDEDLLQAIARETGGVYRRATTGSELGAILEEIDGLEKTRSETREFRIYDERMAMFCWPALLLLLGEILLAHTRFLKIP